MNGIGIELRDGRVNAVTVDQNGRVISRSTEASTPGDLAMAVRAAFRGASANGAAVTALGVTIPFHDAAVPAAVVDLLREESGAAPIAVTAGQADALAETWCGAAVGYRHAIVFAVREHVTAGIVVGGQLLTGANGYAGSVAWLALNPVEREDYRRRGGLEAEIAAAGIVRRLVWRIKSGDQSAVVDRVHGDLSRLSAADVFNAAREGDSISVSVVRDTAKYVGMAIANLASVVDPECVVLGGTLATTGDLMLDAIRSECSRRLRPVQARAMHIALSALGDDAVAIGAARAALLQQS
jgi:glucokinase